MQINPSREQKEVLSNILSWIKAGGSKSLTFGGYAGTGKTTMIAVVRKLVKKIKPDVKVSFCAYTGKASRVLEANLKYHEARYTKDSVSTIHSLIYAPMTDGKGLITRWKIKSALKSDLIVVDEASMVDEYIWNDLLSFDIPILAVGDHGQLPPIGGKFNLMKRPELRLDKIHRQAEGNPIIRLSIMAREDGEIPKGDYGSGVVKLDRYDSASGQEVGEVLENHSNDLMVLVGFNHSRVRLNKQIRQMQDRHGAHPQTGDRLICLRNNWNKGIYNGMVGVLSRIIPIQKKGEVVKYEVEIKFGEDDLLYEGKIEAQQFNNPRTLKPESKKQAKRIGDLFDYGYALTVHKAQGGQAKKVLLFEERSQHMSDLDWRRWLYTGVTRAEEQLVIVGG